MTQLDNFTVVFDPILGRARAEGKRPETVVGGGTSTTVSGGGGVAPASPIYQYQDGPDYTGTYSYVGYEESGGAWYIYRRTVASGLREYATGSSDYATHWANRASESYS